MRLRLCLLDRIFLLKNGEYSYLRDTVDGLPNQYRYTDMTPGVRGNISFLPIQSESGFAVGVLLPRGISLR